MRYPSLAALSVLSLASMCGYASQRLVPAGSLIQCTLSEPKISSKTTAVGDPILCQAGRSERYGRSTLPYDTYLVGRFEDYRDPGHFVGKGWMELRFDRMIVEPDTVIPLNARVVDVPGYNVDKQGRILGKGHAVRDVVEWSIPILWPIDLLNLPRRGPRPTLKEETRVTLKLMDDLTVPTIDGPTPDPNGLYHRTPSAEAAPPPAPPQQEAPAPSVSYAPPAEAPAYAYPPPTYAAPVYLPPPVVFVPRPPIWYAPMPYYAPRYGYYAGPRMGPMAIRPRAYIAAGRTFYR